MGERPPRALLPRAAMLMALGVAFAFGGAKLFERLGALGIGRYVLGDAALTGGLCCSGLLMLSRWSHSRRDALRGAARSGGHHRSLPARLVPAAD